MKFLEARETLVKLVDKAGETGEVSDGETRILFLTVMVELYGCMDQIAIRLLNIEQLHANLTEHYEVMRNLAERRERKG